MLSGRIIRLIGVPLCAFAVLLALYFRDLLSFESRSAKFTPLYTNPPTPIIESSSSPFVEDYISVLPLHFFRDDGILAVNPDGPHPFYELINQAEAIWKGKLDRASRTLKEAATEYRRRYRRAPPRGFDAWWHYVESNGVQLPDEYDQIWRDLEPFWGIDPSELQRLQRIREAHSDTYTLGKTSMNSSMKLLNVSFSKPLSTENQHLLRGGEDFLELFRDIQQHIPPFRAVFSPHDNPTLFTDYELKKASVDAASRGTNVDLSTVVPNKNLGWLSGCSPSSPARQPNPIPSFRANKTFIFDHRKAMDPCSHPQLLDEVGEFLIHANPAPQSAMIPQFAYCSTMMHHDIQIPLLLSWVDDILPRSDDPPWEAKLDERLSWRGSNTGMYHAPETRWKSAQRARLVDFAHELNGTAKVLIPPLQRGARVGQGTDVPKTKLNPAMMDISFAGLPVGCPSPFCDELLRMYEWRNFQGQKEAGNSKYIIDVDGNAWSSRFKRLITSNSLIFKATVYPEWFLDRIQPWVHYIPVQMDYSDVHDALVFFRGGMYGEGAHDELAHRIASAGRLWSKSFWRKEDVTAYVFRLFLEYARVMSVDRDEMSFTP